MSRIKSDEQKIILTLLTANRWLSRSPRLFLLCVISLVILTIYSLQNIKGDNKSGREIRKMLAEKRYNGATLTALTF